VPFPRIDGLRSDPENLVADAAKTSFGCHLSLKAIYHNFATHLHESELSSEDDRRISEVFDMAESTTDHSILKKIEGLVHEEQHLYGKGELANHDQVRLEAIKIELDQCWDLLRQRDARREFGQDPNEAQVRPPSVVERYKQ
jgi:hypothetical protein